MTACCNELKRRKEEEYQMQLFGTHSRSIIISIEQKLKEIISSQFEKLDGTLVKKYNPEKNDKEILKSNVRQLKRTYRQNMQPHLKSIENVVNRFISIPDNILLNEDKCQVTQYTNDEFMNLQRRLENLQQHAKRATVFNAALREEVEIVQKLKASEELAQKLCFCINKGFSAKKVNNKTVRTIERNVELKRYLNELKETTTRETYNPLIHDENLEAVSINSV